MKMPTSSYTSVSLETELLAEIDKLIEDKAMGYKSRAEFIRTAIREKIGRIRNPDETMVRIHELEDRIKEIQEKPDQRIQKLEETIERLQKQVDRISDLEKKGIKEGTS